MKKRFGIAAAGVALAAGISIGATTPALAAMGTASCATNWSYTSATVSASVNHYHEVGGFWRSAAKPAGYSNFKGWWKPGPVWMEINSSGTVSSPYFSCRD